MKLLFFTNPPVQRQGGALDEIFILGCSDERLQCFPTKDLVTLDAENWYSIVGGVVYDALVPRIAAFFL